MSLSEKLKARQEGRTYTPPARPALGQKLAAVIPARLAWRLDGPGDLDPISADERARCGMAPTGLSDAIQRKLEKRTEAEREEAREAWRTIGAPRRRGGPLALPIPVKWAEKSEDLETPAFSWDGEDIPF